jgi:hypothetical protein
MIVESYSNCDEKLFHVYAATLVRVETGKELSDLLIREFHASLLHAVCELSQVECLAAIIVNVPEEPVNSVWLLLRHDLPCCRAVG